MKYYADKAGNFYINKKPSKDCVEILPQPSENYKLKKKGKGFEWKFVPPKKAEEESVVSFEEQIEELKNRIEVLEKSQEGIEESN